MPRCQKTFQPLVLQNTATVPRWHCPHCPDCPLYEAVTEESLLDYARFAEAACWRDFKKPSDHQRPTRLLWGRHPECVWEPADRTYVIYLQQGSDPLQTRLQIGHEIFHRVCSQGMVYHWSHEMMACLVSVRLLREAGLLEYADCVDAEYRRQASKLSLSILLSTDVTCPPYPAGLYGRAYLTGWELQETVGWSALCQLPRRLDCNHIPDVSGWLRSHLTEAQELREQTAKILHPLNTLLGVHRVTQTGKFSEQQNWRTSDAKRNSEKTALFGDGTASFSGID